MTITLNHYLLLSAVLFVIGFYGVLTRRNAVGILISIELMLNAVNINFVAFSRFGGDTLLNGQIFVIFVMTIAAAEAAVGLALVLAMYRNMRDIFVDKINLMKW